MGLSAPASLSSRQVTVQLWSTPKSTTGGAWSVQLLNQSLYQQSSGAQNDSATFDFACDAGTYRFELYHFVGANRGIYTVSVDGSSIGTVDGYAAATNPQSGPALTGVVLTAGQHTVSFAMNSKNAASSSYFALLVMASFTRTA